VGRVTVAEGLLDVVSRDTVALKAHATDWRDAVRLAGRLLLKSGAVNERYVQRMVDIVDELGSYIVLVPGLAMPHARPEDGARRVAVSIVTLKEGVYFPGREDSPVFVLVGLSAVDSESHLKVLSQLAELLSDQGLISRLRDVETYEELVALIKTVVSARRDEAAEK